MKRGILIYNPKSGNNLIGDHLDDIIRKLYKNKIIITMIPLVHGGVKLEKIIMEQTYDMAIIAGGDGTVHSVINAFLKNDIYLPFALIPTGTGNDFATNLEIPNSIDEALNIIARGKTKKVDVGLIDNEKYFFDSFAAGLFAGSSFKTNDKMKKAFGSIAYYFSAVSEMINPKPFKIKLNLDGKIIEEKAFLILIVNGKSVGGFSSIINTADLSDGKMDILILKNCLQIEFTRMVLKLLNNDIVNDKNIRLIKGKKCEILEIDKKLNMTLDGEEESGFPKKIEFLHNKIEIITP